MAERPRIPLPFGRGLDRETGVAVIEPTRFRDLRNVLLYRGKAKVRSGLEDKSTMVGYAADNPDQVIAIHPLRQLSEACAVGYSSSSERVYVNLLTTGGQSPSLIESAATNKEWFTNNASAADPRVIVTDSYGMGFFAHDEPIYQYRADTYYYNPQAAPTLQPLQADLARTGTDTPLQFRGVVRHLNFLFGWGYGTSEVPNRPEIVRASVAGDPLTFEPETYFIAGQRNDPVTCCAPAGNILLVFKETETYQIFGYSKQNFGIRPADTLFGCVAGRLAVTVGSDVFFWSFAGPRVTNGGPSQDLAAPLGLDEEELTTLATEATPQNSFATYDHFSKSVMFVFGSRVYALHLRDKDNLGWTYYEFKDHTAQPSPTERILACAGILYATSGTGGVSGAPTGYATVTTVEATEYDDQLKVTFENVNSDGNEFVEVWAKDVDAAGAWVSKGGDIVTGLTTQTFIIGKDASTALNPLTEYQVAIRYRRGGLYGTGYTSSNPDDWPSTAKGNGITLGYAVGNLTTTWSRTGASAEQVLVAWANTYQTTDYAIQILRNGVALAGSPFANNQAATQNQADTTITGEIGYTYSVRYVRYTDNFGVSDSSEEWTGPSPRPSVAAKYSLVTGYAFNLNLGDATAYTEVYDDSAGQGPALYTTLDPGITQVARTGLTPGQWVSVRFRHKKTAFTTDDFSDMSTFSEGYVQVI